MRPWMAHLISNTAAYNDFSTFVIGALNDLNKALVKAVRANDMELSRGIAHEMKVYEDLKNSVKREVLEHNANITYLNETKGGS